MKKKVKEKRKLKNIMVLFIIVLFLSTIIVLVLKNNKKEEKNYNLYSKIITDLNTVSNDNKHKKSYDELNFGKLLKASGTYEGLFDMGNEDIYKITMNTNNLLFYFGSTKDTSQLYMLDTNHNLVHVGFLVLNNIDAYKEITSKSEKKGTEFTYNNWTYCKIKGGSINYYKLARSQEDVAVIQLGINYDGIQYLNEKEYKELSEALIDCFKIEYYGKKNINDSKKYSNILFSTDMENIKLSDNIKLDLTTNTEIKQIFNDTATKSNKIQIISKDDKFSFWIIETKDMSVKEWMNSYSGQSLNWNSFNYKGVDFYASVDGEKLFELGFEVNNNLYTVISKNNEISYEDSLNYIIQNIIR